MAFDVLLSCDCPVHEDITITLFLCRNIVPLRSSSRTYTLVGLFPGAHVTKIDDNSRTGVHNYSVYF